MAQIVSRVPQTLIDLEAELNALDAKVGDGYTGSTFAVGARKVQPLPRRCRAPERGAHTI